MEGNEVLRQYVGNENDKAVGKQRDNMVSDITKLLQEDNRSTDFKDYLRAQKRKLSFQFIPLSYTEKKTLLTDIGNDISQWLQNEQVVP